MYPYGPLLLPAASDVNFHLEAIPIEAHDGTVLTLIAPHCRLARFDGRDYHRNLFSLALYGRRLIGLRYSWNAPIKDFPACWQAG